MKAAELGDSAEGLELLEIHGASRTVTVTEGQPVRPWLELSLPAD